MIYDDLLVFMIIVFLNIDYWWSFVMMVYDCLYNWDHYLRFFMITYDYTYAYLGLLNLH